MTSKLDPVQKGQNQDQGQGLKLNVIDHREGNREVLHPILRKREEVDREVNRDLDREDVREVDQKVEQNENPEVDQNQRKWLERIGNRDRDLVPRRAFMIGRIKMSSNS